MLSFESTNKIPGKTFAVAQDVASSKILATGHVEGVRLWQLPEFGRLGMVRTRGAAQVLDLATGGQLLAVTSWPTEAISVSDIRASAITAVWDLTGDLKQAPLWQANLPAATLLAFCGERYLLTATDEGAVLLDVLTGSRCLAVPLPEGRVAACCRLPYDASAEPSGVLIGSGRGVWTVSVCASIPAPDASIVSLPLPPTNCHCGSVVIVASSSQEAAAASDAGRVLLWNLSDRALLAIVDVLAGPNADSAASNEASLHRTAGIEVAEAMAWAVSRADDALFVRASGRDSIGDTRSMPRITGLLAVDETVVCCIAVGSATNGGSVLGAWHARTGTRLPHPWHKAAPLDAPVSGAVPPELLPAPTGHFLKSMHAEAGLGWIVISLDRAADSTADAGIPDSPPGLRASADGITVMLARNQARHA